MHGNLLVGPTAIDVDDKEATATTAAGLNEVREKSGLAVKGPAHAPDYHQLCRPARPRAAARFLHWRDCLRLCGLRCHRVPGLSSAPAVGAMVADIVKNSLHLEDDPTFDPTRKGILDPKTLPF